jgi:hypothetical protein
MYRRLAVLLLLLLSACEACATVKPAQEQRRFRMVNPVEFDPPQTYMRMYVEVCVCTGTIGIPFGLIRWFVVDSIVPNVKKKGPVVPSTVIGTHYRGQIFILKGHQLNEQLIRHEIAHAQGFTHWHGALWRCELPQPSEANG